MDATAIQPTPNEIWVGGSRLKIVEEMLLAIADEYDLTLWLNGVKVHTAKGEEGDKIRTATVGTEEESDGSPK